MTSRTDAHPESFQRTAALLAAAYTREEVERAREQLRRHIAAFPGDAGREIDHAFPRVAEAAERRAVEARAMGLSPGEEVRRELLLRDTRPPLDPPTEPDTLLAVRAARRRVQEWLSPHPEDPSALDRLRSLLDEERLIADLAGEPEAAVAMAA